MSERGGWENGEKIVRAVGEGLLWVRWHWHYGAYILVDFSDCIIWARI